MADTSRSQWIRARRLRFLTITGALIAVGLSLATPVRTAALAAVGDWLMDEDPTVVPTHIAVLSSGHHASLLEAADLSVEFGQSVILLFTSQQPALSAEFARRGVRYPSGYDLQRALLLTLGVDESRVRSVPSTEGGSNAELEALRAWAIANDQPRVLVVSPWHHSARIRRIVRRLFPDSADRPATRIPRIDRGQPGQWWHERGTRREGLIEFQKLALDVWLHPLS